MDLGQRFSPNDIQRRFQAVLNGSSPLNPAQSSALAVISTHLPGFLGGAVPAPDMLLRRPLGGSRPDAAVRSLVAPPQAAVSSPAAQEPISAPPPSPLAPPDAVTPLRGYASLFAAPSSQSYVPNPFGSNAPDRGPSSSSGTTPGASFTFERRPGYGAGPGDGDANVPPPTLGPRPGQETYQPPSALNDLMGSLFGGGSASGDSNRGSHFI
jgi:hypothetical protein